MMYVSTVHITPLQRFYTVSFYKRKSVRVTFSICICGKSITFVHIIFVQKQLILEYGIFGLPPF